MFKLRSNGSIFGTLLSHQFERLVLYSTSSVTAETSYLVDYMVKSLGFSSEEAVAAFKKVSPAKMKLSGKPDLVVEFMKQRGLSIAQIKKLVSSMPDVLLLKGKTLEPKFNALRELGVTGSDMARVISSNPSIIRRGLITRIGPAMDFLKSIVGGHDNFLTVLRRSYWFMSCDVDKLLRPNLQLLQSYGFSDERIKKLIVFNADILGHDTKKLRNILHRVEVEFGIPRNTHAFQGGLILLASLSEKTLESKYEIVRGCGLTESDILTMLRKLPRCFMLSKTVIQSRLDFFLNELGCEPAYLASRPYLLVYSMEDRVLPRNAILQVLKEKNLVNQLGILSAVCTSERRFLDQYVLPHKDVLPELCEAYISRKKRCYSVKEVR